jgi:hypothetical protein
MRGNFDYFYHLVNVMGLSLSQSGRINPMKLKKICECRNRKERLKGVSA